MVRRSELAARHARTEGDIEGETEDEAEGETERDRGTI